MVDLRPLTIDDMSSARYVLSAAFRVSGGPHYSDAEIDAVADWVRSPEYTDTLLDLAPVGAWIEGELVGAAAWQADEEGAHARIETLAVRPLFTGLGIGTQLLEQVENHARQAGYKDFSARAHAGVATFLERHGYEVTSHGVRPFGGRDLRVVFLRKRARLIAGDTSDRPDPTRRAIQGSPAIDLLSRYLRKP